MARSKPALARHMSKAVNRLEQLSGTVNLVLEVVDARAPGSTRCPVVSKVLAGCTFITVFTKTDIADSSATKKWRAHFLDAGRQSIVFPYGKKGGRAAFIAKLISAFEQESDGETNIIAAVIGLPNVGKSTVLNMLTGKKRVKVGATPGVTRGLQLVTVNEKMLLMDTPGVVSSGVAGKEESLMLALVGCLPDTFYDPEEAAERLMELCYERYSQKFAKFYDLKKPAKNPLEFYDALAARRGFLLKGGVYDIQRVFPVILKDFSTGRISGITLELPENK